MLKRLKNVDEKVDVPEPGNWLEIIIDEQLVKRAKV